MTGGLTCISVALIAAIDGYDQRSTDANGRATTFFTHSHRSARNAGSDCALHNMEL
jgi:hypothetical protein